MKHLKDYLAESQRVYNYRIKIVGEVDSGFIKALEDKCRQFDIVSWGKTKTTPVQLKPADFPKHSNDSVTSMDVEFRYPAIEPQIKQLAQLLGLDPNRIVMNTTPYEESMDSESVKIEDENKAEVNQKVVETSASKITPQIVEQVTNDINNNILTMIFIVPSISNLV